MFSKLVARNSRRDRKDNGLYFGSMIISIIAFYIILSLSHQDVILFLKKMESDAVNRLLTIIPVFYVATLVVLFFLVYFASSIHMERRSHEFGVYLALGMKRSKLFSMLLLEDLRNNIIALGIGLPVAIIMSELISLITAKVVGLGIIGHKFSLSSMAIAFTIFGFLLVKFVAFVFLSGRTASKEIGELLSHSSSEAKKQLPRAVYLLSAILGVLILAMTYYLGISGEAWNSAKNMGITIFLGTIGTILLFFGMRLMIGTLAKLRSQKKLHTYNFRQIQELVTHRSTVLAVCSLLVFSALCLFGAGVAIATNHSNNQAHILDYTFRDNNSKSKEDLDADKVRKQLVMEGIESEFSKMLEIKIGYPRGMSTVSFESIISKLQEAKGSSNKATLLHNLKQYKDCHLISLNGYNELRKAANLKPIELKSNEASLYMGKDFIIDEALMNFVVESKPSVKVLGDSLRITGDVQSLPIVTDREITLSVALVVTDDTFERYTGGKHSIYVSGILNTDTVKEKGLMRAISDTNEKLNKTSLGYESYIQNMGRQLFFIISASYITIYLAITLLVVANTIIGVQFLMGQRKSYKRYQTLINLGATYETLCKSTQKQINLYFGIPISIAAISSFFGVGSVFAGILSPSARINIVQEFAIAVLTILLLGLFEFVYMFIVKRNSNKYLWTLMEPKREG